VLIETRFTAPTPVEDLWAYLLDVERIAPCMPGAELTEIVDERTWKGKLKAKFGPVAMTFAGTVTMAERDDDAHRVVLHAKGLEAKGKGAADASVTAWLEPAEGTATTVMIQADITMSGFVAQVSRGLLPDVSQKLTQRFADCLQETLETDGASARSEEPGANAGRHVTPGPSEDEAQGSPEGASPRSAAPAAGTHVGGLRLGLWALFRAVGRFFGRLFGRRDDDG
jgi:hypothetical protein